MQFFGTGKRTLLDKALTSGWRTSEEKEQVLAQLRESGLKAVDAIPLLWVSDSAVRQIGVDVFLARPDVAAAQQLVDRMNEQPQHVRSYASRLFARVPADVMTKVVDDLLADKSTQKRQSGWELALLLHVDLRGKYLERAVKEAPLAVRIPALQRLLHRLRKGCAPALLDHPDP
jgi:hypothetical protein